MSPRDEEGFSSCWLCPGRRAVANHPAGGTRRVNRPATGPAAFALTVAGSASGATPFRGHLAFTGVTARRLAPLPRRGLSMGFRSFGFPPACHPATGPPMVTPPGLTPAGHSSLSWTHNCTRKFPCMQLKHRATRPCQARGGPHCGADLDDTTPEPATEMTSVAAVAPATAVTTAPTPPVPQSGVGRSHPWRGVAPTPYPLQ